MELQLGNKSEVIKGAALSYAIAAVMAGSGKGALFFIKSLFLLKGLTLTVGTVLQSLDLAAGWAGGVGFWP
jgi:hypothetical protein